MIKTNFHSRETHRTGKEREGNKTPRNGAQSDQEYIYIFFNH